MSKEKCRTCRCVNRCVQRWTECKIKESKIDIEKDIKKNAEDIQNINDEMASLQSQFKWADHISELTVTALQEGLNVTLNPISYFKSNGVQVDFNLVFNVTTGGNIQDGAFEVAIPSTLMPSQTILLIPSVASMNGSGVPGTTGSLIPAVLEFVKANNNAWWAFIASTDQNPSGFTGVSSGSYFIDSSIQSDDI